MPRHQIRGQLITHLRPDRHQLRRAFDQPQEMPIARVARVGEQPVFTRIDQQGTGQQQRAGAARRDQNPPWVDIQAVTRLVETGDRLAQFGNATGGGVAGLARRQRRLSSANDRLGGGEVRLADFQMDHVVAFGLQFIGPRQQRHHMERFDRTTARTVGGHWTAFDGKKRRFYLSAGTSENP